MRKIKFRGFHARKNGDVIITIKGKKIEGFWRYGQP